MTTPPISSTAQWITDPAMLAARLSVTPMRVGLDTEFIRERTYWPQLALVQIAIDEDILLVDPLAPGIAAALAPLLADRSVLKVMHSASEDLVALKRACGVVPQPLFDTQIAAALAGVGAGVGYQRLVQETLGVALSKGETRSDWLRRPLSDSQLDYAADDVRHLFALHDVLDSRLQSLDRSAWLQEDCARLISNAERDELERWPHLSLRAAQYLDQDAQRRLLRLLRWRDAYARDNDRPRTWILENDFATALARDPPSDVAALQRQLDAQPKAPRRLGEAVWQALATPLADESDSPSPRSDERDKQALRKLQDAVAARSAELGLPDGVLASRRWLEALLDSGLLDNGLLDTGSLGSRLLDGGALAGDTWPGPLAGWRRAQLQAALLPASTQEATGGVQ